MSMLLSRETIKLMMQSQKMVVKEFGVRIDLDDEQAIAMFIAYASQSSSSELKECTNKLMAQLIPGQDTQTDKPSKGLKKPVRYYRGQVIHEPEVKGDSEKAKLAKVEENTSNQKKQVIYRGQRVYV